MAVLRKLLILTILNGNIYHGYSENCAAKTIVSLPQGKVQGKQLVSREGKVFYGFMGIPFAQPPARFQPAKGPPPTWEGIYDATEYKPKCLQFNVSEGIVQGDEDCLYLNVFTPDPSAPGNLPVMEFIHGGGFQIRFYEYGPEFLLDQPVVFVTISYRVASLGFLTTQDEVIPGNNGMKDQVLALRWVHENIRYFGGAQDKITLFGESAGSASTSLHVVSPLSAGLFQQAIQQSGTALDRWPFIESPRETAVVLAEKLGCPDTTSSQAILECLQKKPAEDIVKIDTRKSVVETLNRFGPVLEKMNASDNPAFIQDPPIVHYEQARFAKVPLIITFNNVEGLFINALVVLASPEMTAAFNDDWDNAVASVFYFNKPSISAEVKTWAASRLRQFYFGDRPVSRDTLMNLTDMYTDGIFAKTTRLTALMHGQHAPVYAAMLGFKGIWSETFALGFKEIHGMAHSDDLSYLFTHHRFPQFPVGSESEKFSKTLVRLWTNFATNGNPGYTLNGKRWEPVSIPEIQDQRINWLCLKNTPEYVVEPILERMLLWDEIDRVFASGVIPQKQQGAT